MNPERTLYGVSLIVGWQREARQLDVTLHTSRGS
jgi:hypothetical protein